VIAGHQEDVANYLGVMDVLVHPSLTEAFCQVLIEAMAAGRPVVATDVGGAREVVEDGETGILIAPRDPAAIVASVANLHSSPTLRAQLGEAGRRSVRARFPVDKMVRAQIAMYDAVAERRKGL